MQAALGQLSDAGLLFCRGTAPHASYLFKHALVQDAAYGTLLRGRRQELHARVAAALEQHFADLVERQPELLAHHLTAAGETERAVDQWLKAGQHAAERVAHLEAIRHFDRGLAALGTLPEGPARDAAGDRAAIGPRVGSFAAKGFGAAEAAQAYARARELAERRGDARQLFTAVYGLWQSANGAGHDPRLPQIVEPAAATGRRRAQTTNCVWRRTTAPGRPVCSPAKPAAAREHCEAGRRLYDPERHHLLRRFYGGHDPGACAGYFGAQANWLLGYPEECSDARPPRIGLGRAHQSTRSAS